MPLHLYARLTERPSPATDAAERIEEVLSQREEIQRRAWRPSSVLRAIRTLSDQLDRVTWVAGVAQTVAAQEAY